MSLIRGQRRLSLLLYIYFKSRFERREPSISELGRMAGYSTPSGGPREAVNSLRIEGLVEEKGGRILITDKGEKFLERFILPFNYVKVASYSLLFFGAYILLLGFLLYLGVLNPLINLIVTGASILIAGFITYNSPRVYYWWLKKKAGNR